MTENTEKLPSGQGQLTTIRLSEGCGGEAITIATNFAYNRDEFEGYLGNVGSIKIYMEELSYRDPAELDRFEDGLRKAGLPE